MYKFSSNFPIITTSRHLVPKRWIAGFGVLVLFTAIMAVPNAALACACGCSVFDVGFAGFPQEDDHGGRVYYELDLLNQYQNQIGGSKAPGDANLDKRVNSVFQSIGFQYNFNRDWGIAARLPYTERGFTTQDPDTMMINTFKSRSIGDIQIMGMYTGFSKDMSTGVTFGLKLPTGTYTAPGFDRDTQIGSGSTDLILGGFHRGLITGDNAWQYFAQAQLLLPVVYSSAFNSDSGTVDVYKPGYQFDSAFGVIYNNGYNVLGLNKVTPILQMIVSHRQADSGPAADPLNSGFDRIMISPAIELTKVVDEANKRVLKFYFDVEIPVYYRVNATLNDDGSQGQLIAPVSYKLVSSYNF